MLIRCSVNRICYYHLEILEFLEYWDYTFIFSYRMFSIQCTIVFVSIHDISMSYAVQNLVKWKIYFRYSPVP
jgi:hypothetical protein